MVVLAMETEGGKDMSSKAFAARAQSAEDRRATIDNQKARRCMAK
jgi:hypothetical protein